MRAREVLYAAGYVNGVTYDCVLEPVATTHVSAHHASTVHPYRYFKLSGFGSLAIESVRTQNIPMMQGVVVMGTLVIVGVNLAVDLAYGWVNPKVRAS